MGKILVVAEKPSAGADMAKVLGCAKRGQGYIEGDKYIVTWAIGHLVGLKNPQEHDEKLKTWSLDTLPFRFPIQSSLKVLPATAQQFSVIKRLIQRSDVDSLINAGDAGREGYLIQEWIYRMAGNKKPVKVLWASSLTDEALRKAFSNLHERKEFSHLLEEAEARAETDYLMGMNYSRGLTMTKGGGRTVLRYGRCQTPLLNLIVKRDQEIAAFKPMPYFEVYAEYAEGFSGVLLGEDGKAKTFSKAEDADDFIQSEQSKYFSVEDYKKELKKNSAPSLYNLADLQKDMGSKYGYDAAKTLQVAQSLYEKHKILSYPRTDSRVMSTDVANEIGAHLDSVLPIFNTEWGNNDEKKLEALVRAAVGKVVKDKKYVNDLKVTDHHALIPTINREMPEIFAHQLTQEEQNVFLAVAKRFLAIFLPEYVYSSVTLTATSENRNSYLSKGKTVIELGWRRLYAGEGQEEGDKKAEESDKEIPPSIVKGSSLHVDRCIRKDKITQAPPRYSVSSIVSLMEKYGIGTSATRAEIIKKLMDAKSQYVVLQKGKYSSTELGQKYVALIPEELKSEDLTAKFEEELSLIGDGKLTKDQMLNEVFENISDNLKTFKENGQQINIAGGSKDISSGTASAALCCPKCGKPIFKGKYSWYCSGYKYGCKMSIPLAVAGKTLTETQVGQLLTKGHTGIIKGFKKKAGGIFSAKLKLDESKKVVFDFGE